MPDELARSMSVAYFSGIDSDEDPSACAEEGGCGISVFRAFGDRKEKIGSAGLPSETVNYVLAADEKFFAATDKKMFLYSPEERTWKSVFEGVSSGKILGIKEEKTTDEKEPRILVFTEGGVYGKDVAFFANGCRQFEMMPAKFDLLPEEPSIVEVQHMAAKYAEVTPDKIEKWREGARWKAILPKFSIDCSRSTASNIGVYVDHIVEAPKKWDNDYGVDVEWDLSDLVWNDAQTSIDVRSRLMVQLRNDILEEITRLYFERKKLLMELMSEKRSGEEVFSEKELKVEELTAHLDALTGGEFSRALKNINNK